jgi:subtilisin family serine protease
MTTDNARQTHGTAVAGMAMGSGYGSQSNTKWRGMAPEAEAVLVGVRRDSIGTQWLNGGFSDFVDGIGYMFNYAASVSKPIVVNISWGSQSGPHDGSSLFNQACDALTGPGKILVMSAGNDGREHIHMGKTFTATDSTLTTHVTFDSSGVLPQRVRRTWIHAWGQAGKTWCVDATLYRNGAPVSGTTSVCLDNGLYQRYLIGTGGDTCRIEFTNSLAEANGKPRQIININNRSTDTLRLRFRSTSGEMNVWNEYYYYGYDYGYQSAFRSLGVAGAREGDTMMTVSDMGAAQSVLLVGAYVTRNSWTDITGQTWNYSSAYAPLNKLASFSSIGPYADGRIKPDITAPGLTVATALSSYDTAYTPTGTSKIFVRSGYTLPSSGRTYYYGEFSGTSAAAPAAAGIVALLLQAKPTLTPAEVKDLLFQSAIKDTHTGALPATGTNNWGHGKINAYGALKLLAQQLNVSQTSSKGGDLDCTLFPNPGAGALTLHHTGLAAEDLMVNVYTSAGQVAISRSWTVAPGISALDIDTRDLASGVYLVQITGKKGTAVIRTVVSH